MSLFDRIFVERRVREQDYTQGILTQFSAVPQVEIERISDVFEKVRKPYLQKRKTLSLFLGQKDGALVKPAPDAYGLAGEPHYYFVHAYNCIYECEYCYLQGYFQSPDLVLFTNHDEVIAEMQATVDRHAETVWFHAGEFSDSLALSHITNEWPIYYPFFRKNQDARLELRTKSVNTAVMEALGPLPNVIITFSLSPQKAIAGFDRKTPSLRGRLGAIKRLAQQGFRLGFHLDPIIDDKDVVADYQSLIGELLEACPEDQIEYVSLGVVRFTRDVHLEFTRNYPDSPLNRQEFVKSFDQKIRYIRPRRQQLLRQIEALCHEAGIQQQKVYLCMEGDECDSAHTVGESGINSEL